MFFALLTLASIGLPTTSGFTGEFLVLLGAFNATWPQYQQGVTLPYYRNPRVQLRAVIGSDIGSECIPTGSGRPDCNEALARGIGTQG